MQRLGQLEAVVMDRLWAAEDSLSVREVLAALPNERPRAYTTVMTVLDNLHRKGVVERTMEGKAYRYWATSTREEHTATLMEEVLASGGDRTAALLHFIEHLNPHEAEQVAEAFAHTNDQRNRS